MLTFAAPILALAGLAAATVPIVIHLLWRRRRTPIEWAAMDLLAKAIRRRRRRLELERLLLLAVRVAILVLLGLAIAQPLLDGSADRTARRVWIVLDDGVSTFAQPSEGGEREFATLRSEAVSLIDSLGAGDAAGVILASQPPRVLATLSTDLAGVRGRLETIEPALAASDLVAAIELVQESAADASNSADAIMVLSTFRAGSRPTPGSFELADPGADGSRARLFLREPAVEAIPNTRVASVEAARSPAGDPTALVWVRLEREGPLGASRSRVVVSGAELPEAIERSVAWPQGRASAEIDLSLPLPSTEEDGAPRLAFVVSIDPDGQPADDRRHATLDARSRSRVGIVGESASAGGDWISKALAPSREAPVETIALEPGLLDERSVRDLDAIVVLRPDRLAATGWDAARGLVDRGGMVWLLPPADLEAHEWLDRLGVFAPLGQGWEIRRQVEDHLDAPRSIDPRRIDASWLPAVAGEANDLAAPVSVFRRLAFDSPVSADEIVVSLAAADSEVPGADPQEASDRAAEPIVVAASDPRSGGSLVLSTVAADLGWSDLPIRPLMVPLAQELLRSGLSRGESGRRLVVGTAGTLAAPAASLRSPSGESIELDENRRVEIEIREPGPHRVLDAAGREFGLVAANIDLRAASVETTGLEEVADVFAIEGSDVLRSAAMPERLGGVSKGLPIAAALAWAALGLAVLEILLSRRFSHAARERRRDHGEAPAFLDGFVATAKGRRA